MRPSYALASERSKRLTSEMALIDPRPTLVAVKTALGSWTAVLGVLMVGTGLVVGV